MPTCSVAPPPSLTVNFDVTLQSYRKLMRLAGSVDRIVPGHDPKVRALYPRHVFAGLELTALHEQPKVHGVDALASTDNFEQMLAGL